MWASSYWPNAYWHTRYWAKQGAAPVVVGGEFFSRLLLLGVG